MTTIKEYYKGDMPCNNCFHKNVCNMKTGFEETKFETTHPFIDIQIKCTEYHYDGDVKMVDENELYRESKGKQLKEQEIETGHFKDRKYFEYAIEYADKKVNATLDKIIDAISEYKSRKFFGVGVADLETGKETALDYVLAIIEQCRPENEE